MKNMKIKNILLFGFGSIIFFSVFIIICSISSINNVAKNSNNLYQKPYTANDIMWEIRKEVVSVERSLFKGIATKDIIESKEAVASNQKSIDKIKADIQKLNDLFTSEDKKKLITDVSNLITQAAPIRNEINELIIANKNQEAFDIIINEYQPIYEQITEEILKLSDIASNDAVQFVDSSNRASKYTIIFMIVLLIIGVIYALFISARITYCITKPTKEIMNGLVALSQGDLSVKVTYVSKNELGILADSFRNTCSFLNDVIEDLSKNLNEMSKGNFNFRTQCEERYIGVFKPVLGYFRDMVIKLSSTMSQIKTSAEQVNLSSTQMADSSQELAAGAAEQSASIENLKITIDDVLNQVEANAEDSLQSYEVACRVEKNAEVSSSEMKDMMNAMKKISETSAQIGRIIVEIEDIASKTNLLALNATIEAARAGTSGKGFAVVADEIGKLADDSAKSAVSTRELIESAIKEIENGSSITERTASSLNEVIDGLRVILEKTENGNKASKQQVSALSDIELGTNQISSVVQGNSAVAEETSATSEELSAQADMLNDLVSQFILRQ